MDPVSAFGVVAGAAQLTELAVKVYLGLFNYFRAVKQAPKLSRELRQEALLVQEVLQELESTLESIGTPPPMTSLKNAFDEAGKILKELKNRFEIKQGEIIKQLKWPFTEKENKEYITKLERLKSTLTLATNTIQRYILIFRTGINLFSQSTNTTH
jgi:hypothetical protein